MIRYAARRRLLSKGFLSQAQSRLVIIFLCAILVFAAGPAFAQRGGGHGGGGHWGGGGHFGGTHWGGGGFSHGGARGGRDWGASQPGGGIVVVSGAGARGSAWSRSVPGGGGLREFRGVSREMPGVTFVQGRFRPEGDEFESGAASRHVMIGFPPDRGTWNRGSAPDRAGTVAFAGQGDAIWTASASRAAAGWRNERQVQNARQTGQWQVHVGERGGHARDHSHGRPFRREWLFTNNEFGLFGYPFYGYGSGFGYGYDAGYGFGLFSECPDWLIPNWESQEYYGAGCNADIGIESQNATVAAYGCDQGYGADQSYGAAQANTQRIYGPYASGSPEAEDSGGPAADAAANGPRRPDTLIYLANGTNCAATSYWLAGGNLHYMTSYGAEDSVPIAQIDLQRTVDANAAQGVQFTLRPGPVAGNHGER